MVRTTFTDFAGKFYSLSLTKTSPPEAVALAKVWALPGCPACTRGRPS